MLPLRLYLYAGVAVLLLSLGLWYRHSLIAEGEARVVEADRVAVERQREAVAAAEKQWAGRLQDARTQHDAETAALLVPFPTHRVVCHASGGSPVPGAASVSGGGGPPAAVVPEDAGVHPDIGPALGLLARRADKLAADARELNSLTHE
jgi:hypothetical protein